MTTTTDLTIEQDRTARLGLPARWIIRRDGHPIGLVEQYRKSKTRTDDYRASYRVPSGAFQHFDDFAGADGLTKAVAAIAEKMTGDRDR
jgi:hypothetical protein